jgi:hypothetical protein
MFSERPATPAAFKVSGVPRIEFIVKDTDVPGPSIILRSTSETQKWVTATYLAMR